MNQDEQAIRTLVDKWLSATQSGDLPAVLRLMDDDVIFLVPGSEPFGKDAFAAASAGAKGFHIEGSSDIQEITVLGDWAWMRSRLRIVVTPPGRAQVVRSGSTLTILRKKPDGSWVISRDANLLTPEAAS